LLAKFKKAIGTNKAKNRSVERPRINFLFFKKSALKLL
jgi:hypothetical protein